MSSISGDFMPYLPPQTAPLDTQSPSAPVPTTGDAPLEPSDAPADTGQTPTTAPETEPTVAGPKGHAWGYQHGYGVMFRKLAAAVTNALEAAQGNPTFDANQVLEETMAQFIADNNIEPPSRRVRATLSGDFHRLQAAPSPAFQAFTQMLRSYGIDAHQFRKDFFAAFKQAQEGTVDTSIALQSFPPGTTIDAAT